MGTRRSLPTLVGFLVVLTSLPFAAPVAAASPNVVISQVYGGGGNANAQYQSDFIELFNRGGSAVSLSGWTVQYSSATGTGLFSANVTALPNVSLAAGQHLLVQEATGNGCAGLPCGVPLPTSDATGTIAMGATAGKVIVANTSSGLACNGGAASSTPCNATQLAQIVDAVGYGNANFFEGTGPAPTIANTLADARRDRCTDTDDNTNDFEAIVPNPRNSSTALAPCGGPPPTPSLSVNDVSQNEGNSGTTTFSFTVSLNSAAGDGGVSFDIATADGSASALSDYTAKSLTGQTIPAGASTYAFTVLVNGDTTGETDETFFVNVTGVTGATVSDGQGQGTIVNDDTCGLTFTHTYTIQGSGNTVATPGSVTTEGVVVRDLEGATNAGGFQGFYIQDAVGDGDAATSDGLFVFNGNNNTVDAGDVVRVTGNAGESSGQTQVSATSIAKCGTGTVAATDVEFPVPQPVAGVAYLERFEGMHVRLPQNLTIAEYFNYDRFGEVVLAKPIDDESRAMTPTAVEEPGSAAFQARNDLNLRSRITLDDGSNLQNPAFLRHPNGAAFALNNYFRGGDTVRNTVGVLGFVFGLYRVQPTGPADYTAANPRPEHPENTHGRLVVAAQNTLNFFITADFPSGNVNDNKCGPANNVECRGWDSDQPDELKRQRDKLLATLAGLDADVIGLNELENSTGVEPLGDPKDGIVAGLNELLGAGTYDYVDTGVIGTDAIRVGLIYKPDVVTPVGDFEILDSSDDPRFLDNRSRPVLAQTFEENATGSRFTVAVNHLKSKGDSGLAATCTPNPAVDPDCDQGDGQSFWNHTRTQAAKALVDWLATDPTGSGDPDFLIIGDLNSYAQEDPIDAVKAGPDDAAGTDDDYTNLVKKFLGTFAYSFVFDGQAGYLDHALSSAGMTSQVTGVTEWHNNADEADVLDYDTSFKPPAQDALYEDAPYRSSDHDSISVGLDLDAPPVITSLTGPTEPVKVGMSQNFSATFTDVNSDDTP